MTSRAILAVLACAALCACIDTTEGERGVYDSPCSGSFIDLLRCGRETGGADPSAPNRVDQPERATCRDVCEMFAMCGQLWDSVEECTAECQEEAVPQSLLDCLVSNGCNFEVCFGATP